jgi:hypothetical protein
VIIDFRFKILQIQNCVMQQSAIDNQQFKI